jgi:transposase
MPKIIPLRPLTEREVQELTKRSQSRTLAKRDVERATMILLRAAGQRTGQIAQQLGCRQDKVTAWIKRFNAEGIMGLNERSGRGRPADYSETERGQMIAVARTSPQALGQAYGYWSLRRLAAYLAQAHQIAVSKSQLGQILAQEGLRWYQEKTYFTERPDPDFAEKRGRL